VDEETEPKEPELNKTLPIIVEPKKMLPVIRKGKRPPIPDKKWFDSSLIETKHPKEFDE